MSQEPGSPLTMYLVKQAELAVRSRLEQVVRPWGITALQYTALTVLEVSDELSSADLARLSFVTPQTMTDMVSALQGRGLIERHRDPRNGRRLLIGLTDSGRSLLEASRPHVEALERRMLEGLSESDRSTLRSGLRNCLTALEDVPAPDRP